MESVLEQQRRLHEEKERLMDCMVKEALHKKNTHRETINGDQRMKLLVDRYMNATTLLRDLYEDSDGSRKQEVNALSGPNEFAEFYTRLKGIKDFHKKHPNEISIPMSIEFDEINSMRTDPEKVEENMVDFTDEEGYGKYLDLHQCYEKYINIKGIDHVDYINFLTIFDRLFEINKERKNNDYRKYLECLLEYMSGFLTRVKPLMDKDEELKKAMAEFETKWEAKTFPGWTQEATTTGALTHAGAYLDLSAFNDADELMGLGLDRLKSALIALGLKCGGTLEQRAHRLFQTKGKKLEDIDVSLFAKHKAPGASTTSESEEQKRRDQKNKGIACLEAQVYHFSELLSEQRLATKDNVERKLARGGVPDDEDNADAAHPDSDESDDEDIPYNPKNLPLGWDGKPIPYWLYKLHGLNISYPCEICGNQVYKGPKAFQRHFSEWRHAHGMRCLNIPNTAHFANITKIGDAVSLWQNLKEQKERERFKPEFEEEFEDTSGNVVSRKIFEDLKRQGIV